MTGAYLTLRDTFYYWHHLVLFLYLLQYDLPAYETAVPAVEQHHISVFAGSCLEEAYSDHRRNPSIVSRWSNQAQPCGQESKQNEGQMQEQERRSRGRMVPLGTRKRWVSFANRSGMTQRSAAANSSGEDEEERERVSTAPFMEILQEVMHRREENPIMLLAIKKAIVLANVPLQLSTMYLHVGDVVPAFGAAWRKTRGSGKLVAYD